MNEKPKQKHQWLQKLVGEWTYSVEVSPEPGGPPEKITGTERGELDSAGWALSLYCEALSMTGAGGGRA